MALRKDESPRYVKKVGLILWIVLLMGFIGCGKDNPASPNGSNPDPDPGSPDAPSETELTLIQTLGEHEDLSTLLQIIKDADLENMLDSDGSYTILAPVNSAFDSLAEGFLDNLSQDELQILINYHLIDSKLSSSKLGEQDTLQTMMDAPIFILTAGGNIEFNRGFVHSGSNVIEPDINATNGVIHKVNGVLLPDIYLDVFAIADKRYNLTKFVCNCMTGETDLQSVLESPDAEFTVFIPNDDAFDASNVTALPVEELRNVLEYHIVQNKVMSSELSNGQALETMNGDSLIISVTGSGTITLNRGTATVLEKDLEGSNGVVYVIDSVLTPPDE